MGDLAILVGQARLLLHMGLPQPLFIGVEPGVQPPPGVESGALACSPWCSPQTGGVRRWFVDCVSALFSLAMPRSRLLPRRFREFVEFMAGLDALMPKGGGYLYSRPGLRGLLFTLRICWPLLLARRLGVRRVVWGHSVGPVAGRLGGRLLRSALSGARIVVRDDASSALLRGWHIDHRRAPDLAFVWVHEAPAGRPTQAGPRVAIGVTARTIGSQAAQAEFEAGLARALCQLVKRLEGDGLHPRLLLFPQVIGPRDDEDDRPVLRRVAARVECRSVMVSLDRADVHNVLGAYREIDFLIATRLHSAILAGCVHVPFVLYEYVGGKARGAVADLRLPDWVAVTRPGDLPGRAQRGWRSRRSLTDAYRGSLPAIRDEVYGALPYVRESLR